MQILTYEDLADRICEFTANHETVLFSGAGIGKRVGLPLWHEFLEELACRCEKYRDSLSAQLMRRRVQSGDFLGAAAVYETCSEIPLGERWKGLAVPFSKAIADTSLDVLKPLLNLPLGAIVTTNYDRSFHDAFARARHRSALPLELDDNTLRSGPCQSAFFIARIHGRAERPESMVLYPNSYSQLEQNRVYRDFLLALLAERPCLFAGSSFVDPAIRHVLALYEKLGGPAFKTLHCALLPSDASADLHQWLSRLNVKAFFYDPGRNHKELWRAIHRAQADHEREKTLLVPPPPPKPQTDRYSAFQRFFAFTYAQQKASRQLRPLLEQTRDGLILTLVRDSGAGGATYAAILHSVRQTLHLSEEEALPVVRDSLARMLADEDLTKDGETYRAEHVEPELLAKHLAILAKGVLDRMKVREGVLPSDSAKLTVQKALERIFISRAWDLAAHYAGGGAGYGSDLKTAINQVLGEVGQSEAPEQLMALEHACLSLLSTPLDSEADHLTEVGRAAFALQLVLASPRQALLQRHSLPQRVFFDASVLLPSLVPGHPLRPVYLDTTRRLREASRQAGLPCELLVGWPFLNEIVSHRELAIQISQELNIDRPDNLRRLIAFYGAENVNVYIGAFASHVEQNRRQERRKQTFFQFLREVAPYKNEAELTSYLKNSGIQVVDMGFRQKHNHEFVQVFNSLMLGYEKDKADILGPKEKILVEHEAAQLVQLQLEQASGTRAVFVSADKRLRRVMLSTADLRQFVGMALPPEGFVGLVDIMVGLKADRRSLSRLVWAAPRREADLAIRDYLIARALDQMDAACARAMPEVINQVVAEGRRELEAEKVNWTTANAVEDVARTAKFMDRLENKFFENMRWWIEKEDKESPGRPSGAATKIK